MKNGLMFVLLMAVLVAMAVPAGAVAPVINQLPAVVIGDAEDIDAGTNAVLLKYVNVANLDALTNEPNSGDPAKLKFWYSTTGAKLKVGTPTMKAALTAAEVTALTAQSPAAPAAKELTGGTAFWMSLIQDSPGMAKVSATSVVAATAALNGATPAELLAAGATAPTTPHKVTLYAIDDVHTSKSVGNMTFDVYSVNGRSDAITPTSVIVYDKKFTGTTDGWTFNGAAAAGFAAGTQAASATGLGINGSAFTASATPNGRMASWQSPLQIVPTNAMAGSYLRGTFNMSGNAASSGAAPGFRLLYLSTTYTHMGGIQVLSPAGVTAFQVAYAGNPRTMNLAWAVPTDLVEYGDTGILNKSIQPANDLRTYALQFDLMQTDANDAGAIFLEDVLVEKAPRPADVTPGKVWGGTGIAFNTASTGWAVNPNGAAGFTAGTGAVTAANMTLALAGTSTDGFKSLNPASAAGLPAQTTGKLLRTTYVVASSAPALTPSVRFLSLGTQAAGLAPVFWGDQLDYGVMRGTVTPAQSATGLPGSFKTAGSTVEFYAPGQYAGTGAEAGFMTPQCDLIQGAATYPLNGWARPSATVTVSSVKMETVNP